MRLKVLFISSRVFKELVGGGLGDLELDLCLNVFLWILVFLGIKETPNIYIYMLQTHTDIPC